MSYLSEQKTEMKQAQVAESLLRMKKLKLHENAIKEFYENGKLNLSEKSILFWLNEEEEEMVRKWESETGNIVFHVIKNQMEFGLCYTFLYVSQDSEEWVMENEDLEKGYVIAYVKNVDDELCSEYGGIIVKSANGGLLRTA